MAFDLKSTWITQHMGRQQNTEKDKVYKDKPPEFFPPREQILTSFTLEVTQRTDKTPNPMITQHVTQS